MWNKLAFLSKYYELFLAWSSLKISWKSVHMLSCNVANRHEFSPIKNMYEGGIPNIPKIFQIVPGVITNLSWYFFRNSLRHTNEELSNLQLRRWWRLWFAKTLSSNKDINHSNDRLETCPIPRHYLYIDGLTHLPLVSHICVGQLGQHWFT